MPERSSPGFPSPVPVMELSTAYWGSQILFTANRLGLFDLLAGDAMSSADVASALSLQPRMTGLFLNACVALGLCEMSDGRYSNSRASSAFLISTSPAGMGNAISYSDDLYGAWGELERALKTGGPAVPAEAYLGSSEEETRHFVHGMHDRAMAIGRALPDALNLEGRRRMLDVGGGPGTFSALLTDRYAGLESDVLELAGVVPYAEELLASNGASDRVRMIAGDYHETEFGDGYDVVLMSGMFHRETLENCRQLIRRAVGCLVSGGMVVVSDVFTDSGGTSPEFAALFGVNMMLTAPDGGVHSDAQVAEWLIDSGCTGIERKAFPPPMPHRIVTGTKP